MSVGFPRPCCVCGGPEDPAETQMVVIPKGVAHYRCWSQIPAESIWDFADTIPCCTASQFLSALGGTVVRRSKNVPPGEIWFFDEEKGAEARFRLTPGGKVDSMPIPRTSSQEGVDKSEESV